MSKHVFKREIAGVPYRVEAEMLVSGASAFTFVPPLPGRAPVLHVDAETTEDIVRTNFLGIEYDPEVGAWALTLPYCHAEGIGDNEEVEDFKVATQLAPDAMVLEDVLDIFVEDTCPECARTHFGDDVWPSLPGKDGNTSALAQAKKPPLLN
jgi:hypothetical protein